ncbi:MAG: hypothetical protein BEN18_10030 [Epulopiscium sp. Nuni2H_MBin001]|nr:MAG: hypothetical protein BEN18_10030 [Epulopiscium sp. Nuni2H_MBin001]
MNLFNKKILLVDNDVEILNLLKFMFQKEQFTNVYLSTTGNEAIQLFNQIHPDCMVIDIILPDKSGIEVCREIRQTSMVPILFLSAKSDEVDKLIALNMGGDSYITKPFSPKVVIANVASMLRRTAYYTQQTPNNILSFGKCTIDFNIKEVYKEGKNVNLTSKEYYLLEYLINNRQMTVSREQILEAVWGDKFEGYDNTVMVHISKLREKIEDLPSTPVHIITVKGRGYRFIV